MKPMKRLEKKNKEGFTLIELVIVIALLAILMTLAVPAYKNLQEQARQNVADANARSYYSAYQADWLSSEAAGLPGEYTGNKDTFGQGIASTTAVGEGATWTDGKVTGYYP